MRSFFIAILLTLVPACDAVQYRCQVEVTKDGTVCVWVDMKPALPAEQ